MRRIQQSAILIMVVLFILSSFTFSFAGSAIEVDDQFIDRGIVGIKIDTNNTEILKVMISKGDTKLFYNLDQNQTFQYFPLQLGNGFYTLDVLKNVKGKSYEIIYSSSIELMMENENDVFLNSIKLINWNIETEVVKKAQELTQNLKTDMDKIQEIFEYVINTYSYDYDKVNLPSTYIPNLNLVHKVKKGICYDYSAIVAAMLRSISVPTKLVMGNTEDKFHAWNEVYNKDTNTWFVIDTTKASVYKKAGQAYTMIEKTEKYVPQFVY